MKDRMRFFCTALAGALLAALLMPAAVLAATPEQGVETAFAVYVQAGLDPGTALERTKAKLPEITANPDGAAAIAQADLAQTGAALSPETIVAQAFALYVQAGLSQDAAFARVTEKLPELVAANAGFPAVVEADLRALGAGAPAAAPALVPLKSLANYRGFKRRMSDAEFAAAYEQAAKVVAPLVGLPREQQLVGIAQTLRAIFDSGMSYSMSTPHYNDPYGYLVLGVASCAGCARTTGLCLNMLGIPYEHVNENQYSHQWARVPVGGTYWICDAFGLYCGPEPAPYRHPRLY